MWFGDPLRHDRVFFFCEGLQQVALEAYVFFFSLKIVRFLSHGEGKLISL